MRTCANHALYEIVNVTKDNTEPLWTLGVWSGSNLQTLHYRIWHGSRGLITGIDNGSMKTVKLHAV